MRYVSVATLAIVFALAPTQGLHAQVAQSTSVVPVPRFVSVSGVYQPADGQPPPAGTVVTLLIYADEQGGTPLWQETQNVVLDKSGRYSLLLGNAQADGIPLEVFTSGEAQWLALHFAGLGEVEGPRTRITSVPYALRSADADTLGGHPASAYLLAPTSATADGHSSTAATSTAAATAQSGSAQTNASTNAVLAGTPNVLAKYVTGVDVGNSALFESGGLVGINTTAPADALHVRFTNTIGTMTGLAVQNLGNTPTSYSGTLFYDQNGQLGQFQGFNNSTHEYRINNIANNGSINFMLNSGSKFLVAPNGNIGIGTTAPAVNLEVSNALSTAAHTLVLMTSYGDNSSGSATIGRKARGTVTAPTAVQNGDELATFGALGYGATAFSPLNFAQGLSIRAAQNWTDTGQATSMSFSTTPPGGVQPAVGMTLNSSGNLGIGTTFPHAPLEVSRTGTNAGVVSTLYANGADAGSFLVAETARGTAVAPLPIQAGDILGALLFNGYDTTGFGEAAVVGAVAAENFTGTARGTAIGLGTTPLGGNDSVIGLALLPSGNVSIGTPADGNGIPTATDKLQVFGDVRVGTTVTSGCVKNFAGTGIAGTCSSDRRLKRDITPFGSVLNQLTALQPVHFYWRAAEFPDRHFGEAQAYGLIAQDVEQVLPELVVTGEDGFKQVDYAKLPLLTIQAVKELKERVAELERLIQEMRAMTPGR